jgi:hypothetical protein
MWQLADPDVQWDEHESETGDGQVNGETVTLSKNVEGTRPVPSSPPAATIDQDILTAALE